MTSVKLENFITSYIPLPVCVIDRNGKIISAGDKIGEVFLYDNVVDADIFAITGIKAADLFLAADNGTHHLLNRNGKIFKLICQRVDGEEPGELTILFEDVTSLEELKDKYNAERLCIGKIQIDNYDELIANTPVGSRISLPNEIDKLVRKWAEKISASINKMNEPGITSITLPNTIRSIGSGAFSETNIKEFYMPDCVEEIGSRLFAFCRSLENVVISKNINKLSDEMFLCCYKLNDIDWQPAKGTFGRNAFKECQGLTSITIPQNMNFSYDGATFTYCSNIETLTIEDSSEKLRFDYNSWRGDHEDIYECEFNKSKIKTLYLGRPYDVDYIYPNFNNLENLAIGSMVTELEYWPNVNNLRTLDIGTNLNNVTDFSENTSLEKIIVRSNVPPTAEGFSNATYLNAVLYVPQGAKDIYMQTPIWKYFFNIEEISSTGIGSISPMENVGDDVYYSIDGRRIAAPRKGINIIRKANGTVKKVLIK